MNELLRKFEALFSPSIHPWTFIRERQNWNMLPSFSSTWMILMSINFTWIWACMLPLTFGMLHWAFKYCTSSWNELINNAMAHYSDADEQYLELVLTDSQFLARIVSVMSGKVPKRVMPLNYHGSLIAKMFGCDFKLSAFEMQSDTLKIA